MLVGRRISRIPRLQMSFLMLISNAIMIASEIIRRRSTLDCTSAEVRHSPLIDSIRLTCIGNFMGSRHFSEGGYDRIATKLFQTLNVSTYYLEYDTAVSPISLYLASYEEPKSSRSLRKLDISTLLLISSPLAV